jgi:hypothetical protein
MSVVGEAVSSNRNPAEEHDDNATGESYKKQDFQDVHCDYSKVETHLVSFRRTTGRY